MTIEFYSAELQEFLTLFLALNENGDVDGFFEKLENYPKADFSFHIRIPEDMDRLCQALRLQNDMIPSTFSENTLFIPPINRVPRLHPETIHNAETSLS